MFFPYKVVHDFSVERVSIVSNEDSIDTRRFGCRGRENKFCTGYLSSKVVHFLMLGRLAVSLSV